MILPADFYYFCGMKKCLIIIAMCCAGLSTFAQHEGIERHFDEYVFGDFVTQASFYSADTLTDGFHLFAPAYPFAFSTGNMALPASPAFFADMGTTHEFIFFQPYAALFRGFDKPEFFDARKPFTKIQFVGGGKQLDDIAFVHTQNIKPWLNVGAEYRSLNSLGLYARQQLRGHSAHLFVDFHRNRYAGHLDFIHNKITHQNNGGIESDSVFMLNVQRPENLNVNLYNSSTRLGQTGVMYSHSLMFGPWVSDTIIKKNDTLLLKNYTGRWSLGHDISLNRYYRVYEDVPSGFYQNIYIDSLATNDSMGLQKMHNEISLRYITHGNGNKFPDAAMKLAIAGDVYAYTSDTSVFYDQILKYRWFDFSKKLGWDATASWCFMGRRAGDVHLNAELSYKAGSRQQHLVSARLSARNERPDAFLLRTTFNHFRWEVADVPYRDLRLTLGYLNKPLGTDLSLQYSFLDSYLYFNEHALPVVNQNNVQVISASLGQLLHLGPLYWRNQLQAQYFSDNTAYDLPALGVQSSLYVKTRIFKRKMGFQTGIDASWMSPSKGFAYMPATGIFYRSTAGDIGNFLVLDFHATISIKRFRAFAKLSHFNQAFMKANYFGMPHYPVNPLVFNFGISWEFYD